MDRGCDFHSSSIVLRSSFRSECFSCLGSAAKMTLEQPMRSMALFDPGPNGRPEDGPRRSKAVPEGTAHATSPIYFLSAFRMNHPPTPKSMAANAPANQLPCSTAMEMNTNATIRYASAKITTPIR